MKRRFFFGAVLAITALSLTANSLWAQQAPKPLLISSGADGGTYFRLVKELGDVCTGLFENRASTGSLENLDRVTGNQSEMGITQFDALYLRGQREADIKSRIRVLAMLYPEEIHLITKSAPKSEGGYLGTSVGAKMAPLNTINDLRGRKVGFWGGSTITEKVIASVAYIGWEPVEQVDQRNALSALRGDQIDAILAVGGQPLGWVTDLSRDFKLLEVPDQVAKQLDAIYNKTTLSYRNLGQDGVQALAVDALLVTRNYSSMGMVTRLKGVRDCLANSIGEIRDTRDTHPKWLVIDPAREFDKWPMFLAAPK